MRGKKVPALVRLATTLGLDASETLLGRVEDIADMIRRCKGMGGGDGMKVTC